ncbi:DsrE family protein [Verrucomicrobiaceae bacterium R5-34]|nr:DsrE family protein [Verrucomicrobiaceae bacterium R5-34]
MTSRKATTRKTKLASLILMLAAGTPIAIAQDATRTGVTQHDSGNPKIPLQVTTNIKVVYQISDDRLKGTSNRGLTYAKKLLDTYSKQGVADKEIDLHLVFHGSSLTALVDAKTRKKLKADGGEANPNLKLIQELLQRGVSIEVCESSMEQKGIVAGDFVSKEIATVVGAFPRLISLQQLGYAYIKFE